MLKAKKIAELIEIAEKFGIADIKGLKKQEIIDLIINNADQKSTKIDNEKNDNNPKPHKPERNNRNGGNKPHFNKNHSNRKDDNFNKDHRKRYKAVSYTHLTLPTIE